MIKINHKALMYDLRECIETGLRIGQSAAKKAMPQIYPTPSGMNIKIPKNPFLNTSSAASIRCRKDVTNDIVLSYIPDGYTKEGSLEFLKEQKKDIILTLTQKCRQLRRDKQLSGLKVKIGECVTPPHFCKKMPLLEPHYFIEELWSNGKNTGTNAIKSVVLRSLKDPATKGRVLLDACPIDGKTSPVGFYYKLGFRSTNPYNNEACAKWLAEGGKKENAPGFSVGLMYLPKENIQHCLNYGLNMNI